MPRAPPPGPEADLVRRLAAGDEEAFASLLARLGPAMLRLARSLISDRALAEEIVQDTWAAALEALPGFEGRSSLKTWICHILVNRAKTRRAQQARTVPFSSFEDRGGDEPAVEPSRFAADGHWSSPPRRWDADTPERLVLRAETLAEIEAALAGLPDGQRAVVTLRDVEGWTADEVCNVLQISETNQRVLLHRGRSKLRALLERTVDRGR